MQRSYVLLVQYKATVRLVYLTQKYLALLHHINRITWGSFINVNMVGSYSQRLLFFIRFEIGTRHV